MGFKLTKQSLWRSKPIWQEIAANRNLSASRFMPSQPGMGLKFIQFGRVASSVIHTRNFLLFWIMNTNIFLGKKRKWETRMLFWDIHWLQLSWEQFCMWKTV